MINNKYGWMDIIIFPMYVIGEKHHILKQLDETNDKYLLDSMYLCKFCSIAINFRIVRILLNFNIREYILNRKTMEFLEKMKEKIHAK